MFSSVTVRMWAQSSASSLPTGIFSVTAGPSSTSIEISERGYKGEILWDDPHFLESNVELKVRLSASDVRLSTVIRSLKSEREQNSPTISPSNIRSAFSPRSGASKLSVPISMTSLLGDMNYFVSSIGFFHTLDLRDSPVVPSRGFVFDQTFELAASAIGSEIEYFRTTARASYFIPIGKTLLEFGARAGVVRPLTESTSDINGNSD